ncbi:MAG: Large-conductance mechanosensitive channel, partial [uncultured Acidimicrobiales bacterium]
AQRLQSLHPSRQRRGFGHSGRDRRRLRNRRLVVRGEHAHAARRHSGHQGLLPVELQDQRQHLPLRPVHQRPGRLPAGRRRRLLLRCQAGERAHGPAQDRARRAVGHQGVRLLPEQRARPGDRVRVLHPGDRSACSVV